MNKALTIGLAGAAIAAALLPVVTGGTERDRVTAADALPAYEILTNVRSMGLNPAGEPVRRGHYYILHAYEPTGAEVRLVADAQFGDVVSVTPAALSRAYVPPYRRGARIIQVPQPGDRDEDWASTGDRDAPGASNDDDAHDIAPAPRRRAAPSRNDSKSRSQAKPKTQAKPQDKPQAKPDARSGAQTSTPRNVPRWRLRSDSPPPPPPTGPRRAVLSAPPPGVAGPTPIRPTPNFDAKPAASAKVDATEKFANPATVTEDVPPQGYTPPAAPPAPAEPASAAAAGTQNDAFGDAIER